MLVLCAACVSPGEPVTEVHTLDLNGRTAMGPYFTVDHAGVPVLCWTEKPDTDSLYRLAFARYEATSGNFGPPVIVAGSEGISTSPESMGKVAFKGDGTVVAVFAKRFTNEKNPFAGAIYYTISRDGGMSWTEPDFLHTDTAHHYGRQFFDLARLANGEVGSVWLDGRDRSVKGSTLYFAATVPRGGFAGETAVHRGTCECCRTDLMVDEGGTIHIAYRSLMYPAELLGQQVRDMAYIRSDDNGVSFTEEIPISADYWAIEGCPHTGPALAATGGNLHAIWFTAGGKSGLYYAGKAASEDGFGKRNLLTSGGMHPQMAALDHESVVVAYSELLNRTTAVDHAHGAGHGHAHHAAHTGTAAGQSRILLQLITRGRPVAPVTVSDGPGSGHHPVIAVTGDQVVTAWVREDAGREGVRYTVLRRQQLLAD